jgi:hypothetical protein
VARRQSALSHLKEIWQACKHLGVFACRHGASQKVKDLARDVFWVRRQLVLKMGTVLEHTAWDASSQTLRDEVWKLFAGVADTKFVCEDVFNVLRDANRASKNKRINEWRAMALAATAPSLKHSGACVPGLSNADWNCRVGSVQNSLDARCMSAPRLFHVQAGERKIDDGVKLDGLGQSTKTRDWQPAGPAASRRMVTATLLALNQSPVNFDKVDRAWRSKVFHIGFQFLRVADNRVFASLGASEWGWLALEVPIHKDIGGFDWLSFKLPDDRIGQRVSQQIVCGLASCAA